MYSFFHFVNCFGFDYVDFFPSLPVLLSSLIIWWLSLVLCLGWFFFCVYVSIVNYWFVVIIWFWYSNLSLYIYKIVLICWFLNFKCISHILHLYSSHNCWFWSSVSGWFPAFTVCLSLLVSFPICNFIISIVTNSFPSREISLVFVTKLVWCCWILLDFACL